MDHIRPDGRGRGMEGIGREKGSLGRGTKEGRNRLKMRVLYCRWHRYATNKLRMIEILRMKLIDLS